MSPFARSRSSSAAGVLSGAVVALLSLAVGDASAQSTYSVPGDYTTIQAAIDAAADGDTIQVDPGTYREAIDLGSKAITVESTGGVASTLIDGELVQGDAGSRVPVVVKVGQAPASGRVVLRGLTIARGAGGYPFGTLGGAGGGSGIAADRSRLLVEQCVIVGNASDHGAGIYAFVGDLEIRDTTLSDNHALYGGGLNALGSALILSNVDLTGNTASVGAGVYINEPAAADISGGRYENNSASSQGGAMYIQTSAFAATPSIAGVECVGNSAVSGGGIAFKTGFEAMTLTQVLLQGNVATSGPALAIVGGGNSIRLVDSVVCDSGASPFSGNIVLVCNVDVASTCGDCDADGVPDVWELLTGVAVDTDGDGVQDQCDNCPNDPDKTEPGDCGCGVADVDTNSDGISDCAAYQYLVTTSSAGPVAGDAVTITAQLADFNGNPVSTSGLTVTWSDSFTGGGFASPTSLTDGSGVATVEFTTPTIVAAGTVTATDDGSLTGTSGSISTVAGAAAAYLVSVSNIAPVAGSDVTVSAQLVDANDNPVSTSGLTVTWSDSFSGGAFASATSETSASGLATVTFTTPTTVASGRNVSIPMRQLGHGFFGDFEGVRLVSCCDPAVVLGVARGLTGRVAGGVIDEASCVGMLACSHSARGS